MFAASAMPVERPAQWRSNSYHNLARSPRTSPNASPHASPPASRRSSVSSVASAQTDPGFFSDRTRQSSLVSTGSEKSTSSKSGFRTLFGKKDKKPKEKKDLDKLVLTSKHAAAVKTRMMMDPRYKDHSRVKTAEIIPQRRTSSHSTAAQQEARHPHSGPPALHAGDDMPSLTRIVSGDENDEEEEMERKRLEWEMAKTSGFARIREHPGGESASTSSDSLEIRDNSEPGSPELLPSPDVEKILQGIESRRPVIVAKNSYGGRFHRDEKGHWTR